MSKIFVSALKLYSLVDEEFTRLRPVECKECVAPRPIRRVPPIDSNWALSAARPCTKGCRQVLRDIEERFERKFALEDAYDGRSVSAEA